MSTEVYKALHKFQKSPPAIKRTATNPHYRSKYARLEDIMGAVGPELNKHGLVVVQNPEMNPDGVVSVSTSIIHVETGELISSTLSSFTNGDPQKVGSAITYLRRYGLSAMLGIVTEDDDDGNGASVPKSGTTAPKEGKTAQKVEPAPGEDKEKHDLVKKIAEIALQIAEGDKEQAAGVLEEVTEYSFKKDDGTVFVSGVRTTEKLKEFSVKRLKASYGRAKESLEAWEASHGKEGGIKFQDSEIPF